VSGTTDEELKDVGSLYESRNVQKLQVQPLANAASPLRTTATLFPLVC
jgi:hypothetical protein